MSGAVSRRGHHQHWRGSRSWLVLIRQMFGMSVLGEAMLGLKNLPGIKTSLSYSYKYSYPTSELSRFERVFINRFAFADKAVQNEEQNLLEVVMTKARCAEEQEYRREMAKTNRLPVPVCILKQFRDSRPRAMRT